MQSASRRCPICRTEHAPDAPCMPHWGARTAGMVDALQGKPMDEAAWPQGRYGHADYAMGYYGITTPQPGAALATIGRKGER